MICRPAMSVCSLDSFVPVSATSLSQRPDSSPHKRPSHCSVCSGRVLFHSSSDRIGTSSCPTVSCLFAVRPCSYLSNGRTAHSRLQSLPDGSEKKSEKSPERKIPNIWYYRTMPDLHPTREQERAGALGWSAGEADRDGGSRGRGSEPFFHFQPGFLSIFPIRHISFFVDSGRYLYRRTLLHPETAGYRIGDISK